MRALCLAIATAALTTGAAQAATLNEGTGSAEFSGDWKSPTMIDAGIDRISGSWSVQNDYDILGFTALKAGAQTITLSFSPLSPIGDTDWSFAAGGKLYWQTTAPRYSAWEGKQFSVVDMLHGNRKDDFTYSLHLGADFAGVLYLSLYGTHGSLNYNIDVPGNAVADPQPAPVPLPAGAVLLPAGLAALAVLRRRRKTR